MFVLEVISQQTLLFPGCSQACDLNQMLLTRSAVVAAARTRPAVFALQSRAASSSHGHHDHHQHDMTTYPPESAPIVFCSRLFCFSFALTCRFCKSFLGKGYLIFASHCCSSQVCTRTKRRRLLDAVDRTLLYSTRLLAGN